MDDQGATPPSETQTLVVLDAATTTWPVGLADLTGVTIVELILQRLSQLDARIVVTCSDRPLDDAVEQVARRLRAPVVRGPADDLLGRLAIAMVRHPGSEIVHLAADCPLHDPFLIAAAVGLHRSSTADVTTNLLPRTHPEGLDLAVLAPRALRCAAIEATDPLDRARPARYLVRRPERFRLANLEAPHDASQESWRIVDSTDVDAMRTRLAQIPDASTASWSRALAVLGRTNRIAPGTLVLQPGPAPEPGTDPWTRRYQAVLDGQVVGSALVTVSGAEVARDLDVAPEHVEAARTALYRLLLHDLQADR